VHKGNNRPCRSGSFRERTLRSRKGTSFENLTQAELKAFITEINDRPRKILGWATLAEIFQELCSQ